MPASRLPLACLLLVSGFLGGCSRSVPSPPAAPSKLLKVRFLTDWYPQAEHGGFYEALANGYYRDEGLDVELIPGGPGASVAQKMVAGVGEIGMSASDWVIIDDSKDLPFVMVCATMQHDPQAILVHDESPVHTLKDLDGRRVMGEPGANWIDYLTARYGIKFSLIPMNYGIAQFMADKDLIQQCFITNEPYYLQQRGVAFRTLLIADSGYDPYRVVFTTRRFAREHPEAVRGFVAASIRGWEAFIHGNPEPAKRLIAARNDQMSSAFMDYSIATLRQYRIIDGKAESGERTGQLTRGRIQEQIDLLARLHIIPAPLPLDQVATFDFLPPAVMPGK
jgi:NitT/TauT family transport system substrate-binding protein